MNSSNKENQHCSCYEKNHEIEVLGLQMGMLGLNWGRWYKLIKYLIIKK